MATRMENLVKDRGEHCRAPVGNEDQYIASFVVDET
jgi:hypothetical protein